MKNENTVTRAMLEKFVRLVILDFVSPVQQDDGSDGESLESQLGLRRFELVVVRWVKFAPFKSKATIEDLVRIVEGDSSITLDCDYSVEEIRGFAYARLQDLILSMNETYDDPSVMCKNARRECHSKLLDFTWEIRDTKGFNVKIIPGKK